MMVTSSTWIDAPVPAHTDRQSIIDHAKKMFWKSDIIRYDHEDSWQLKRLFCKEYLPVLYYSRSMDVASQCYTNAGTVYQFFASNDEYKKCFTFDNNEMNQVKNVTDSTNSDSKNGASKCECNADEPTSYSFYQEKLCECNKTIINLKRLLHVKNENEKHAAKQLNNEACMDQIDNLCNDYFDNFSRYASSLKWISVGQFSNDRYRKGYKRLYIKTTMPGFSMIKKPSKLAYEETFNALQNFIDRDKYQDYRRLAIKVDLYDNLRERSFSQPSGVEYAWANKNPPVRDIISLNSFDQWHYDAIFVTVGAINKAIGNNEWKLNVGDPAADVWSLRDRDVRIIPLDNNPYNFTKLGRYMWILSHLSYPLVWVIDQFDMAVISGNNKHKKKREAFVHTAGLVDIFEPANKLIFVLSDNVANIGGTRYQVNNEDEKIVVHNFDRIIENCLDYCLRSPDSLREAFMLYTERYFSNKIDWPEINSLTTALIVRWHQKIECYKKDRKSATLAVGAPASVLKVMGLTPDPKITDKSYPGYGGTDTVNSLDQRYLDRELVRFNPAIKLGTWDNMVSIALITKFAQNELPLVPDSWLRCRASVHDCLFRARFLRKAFEQWKRRMGQDDRLAFPRKGNDAERNWYRSTSDTDIDSELGTSKKFAKYFINEHVSWSWQMNLCDSSSKTTLTGIRTVSSWWRSQKNTHWFPVVENPDGPQKGDNYVYSYWDWTEGNFLQFGPGKDNPEIERKLMRLDLNAPDRDWGFTYKSDQYPTCNEIPGVSWIVDSSYGGKLAANIGWLQREKSKPILDVWGWGIAVALKNDSEGAMKTLVIPYETAGIASGRHFNKGTILFKDRIVITVIRMDHLSFDVNEERYCSREEEKEEACCPPQIHPLMGCSEKDLAFCRFFLPM